MNKEWKPKRYMPPRLQERIAELRSRGPHGKGIPKAMQNDIARETLLTIDEAGECNIQGAIDHYKKLIARTNDAVEIWDPEAVVPRNLLREFQSDTAEFAMKAYLEAKCHKNQVEADNARKQILKVLQSESRFEPPIPPYKEPKRSHWR